MKKIILTTAAGLVFLFVLGQSGISKRKCTSDIPVNPLFSKAVKIDSILRKCTAEGIPGIDIAIYSDEGWWEDAVGWANSENHEMMETCHLQYLQSIAKCTWRLRS
jgi:hypothetical protein